MRNFHRDMGWALHLVAGWVIAMLFMFGFAREVVQHGSSDLSLHQWIEAFSWGFGGMLAVAIWDGIRWLRSRGKQ